MILTSKPVHLTVAIVIVVSLHFVHCGSVTNARGGRPKKRQHLNVGRRATNVDNTIETNVNAIVLSSISESNDVSLQQHDTFVENGKKLTN